MAMSDDHKAALAQGRTESGAVKRYLTAVGGRKPGRPVTRQSLSDRLAKTQAALDSELDPLKRLDLIQTKLVLEDQLASVEDEADLQGLEDAFVGVASSYSARKGISYSAWREIGVPPGVLARAGIPRTRRG